MLTNLAQNATRVSTLCSSGGSRVRRNFGPGQATFERDFSLGYCSSAQGEHRLAHELDRAGAIACAGATWEGLQCGLFADVAKSTFDCETARLRHPDG